MRVKLFMLKISTVLVFLLIHIGCKEKRAETTVPVPNKDTSIVIQSSLPKANTNWADSLIIGYINRTDNEMIQATRSDSIPIEWMFDRTEQTDSAKYLVFQLGHSFEHKYITDGWLYIDSLTKAVYEYDIANDSLIKWRK